MSRGQQQKSMLSKLLYSKAKMLLLDEPSNYLDYRSQIRLWNTLQKESESRLILATVHDPRLLNELNAKVLVMSERRFLPWEEEMKQSDLLKLL